MRRPGWSTNRCTRTRRPVPLEARTDGQIRSPVLKAEAPTPSQLATIQAVIAADLERFGHRHGMSVHWSSQLDPARRAGPVRTADSQVHAACN